MARPFTRNQHTAHWRKQEHAMQIEQDAKTDVLWLHRAGMSQNRAKTGTHNAKVIHLSQSYPKRFSIGQWVWWRNKPRTEWCIGQVVSMKPDMGAMAYVIQSEIGTRHDILDSVWHLRAYEVATHTTLRKIA